MINKLPDVGGKYREKFRIAGEDYNLIEVVHIKATRTGTYAIYWVDTNPNVLHSSSDYLEDFWDLFEELPYQKPTTTYTTLNCKSHTLSNCAYCGGSGGIIFTSNPPQWKECSVCSKSNQEPAIKEDLTVELSDDVKEAMEE